MMKLIPATYHRGGALRHNASGPVLDSNARLLLQATYLRPLRDAERELDAGRNSRLSQILMHTKEITAHKGEEFDPAAFIAAVKAGAKYDIPKSIANISRLADYLIAENDGIKQAGGRLNKSYLSNLSLGDETLAGRVSVGKTRPLNNVCEQSWRSSS
jgi:putative ATP-dependent endonuclease of OLD family